MRNRISFPFVQSHPTATAAGRILLSLMLAATTAAHVHAQGQLGSGTVSGVGSGPYSYSLTFGDLAGATAPIGSVWYAWVPGLFYLPGTPTSASAPAGWTATVSGNSVQFVATSALYEIAPGSSLSGFGYHANFSPAQLAAAANSGVSVAYSGGLFSDAGNTFTVLIVPEPSTWMLGFCAVTALWFASRRKQQAA